MEPVNHAVTIPSEKDAPAPSGIPLDTSENAPASPSPENPWLCKYKCMVKGHKDSVTLLWDGTLFSLPETEANDPTYGGVAFSYDPPISSHQQ